MRVDPKTVRRKQELENPAIRPRKTEGTYGIFFDARRIATINLKGDRQTENV